jgi:hypothetical protein
MSRDEPHLLFAPAAAALRAAFVNGALILQQIYGFSE